MFGPKYMGTLFGIVLFTHQLGGFLGAYLGGLALNTNGDYQWMWWADIALSGMAALINLPIQEAPIAKRVAA
jgi:predicted MFS family arabinose efflux permease